MAKPASEITATPLHGLRRGETHPPRYLMHKYWSRKPHNLVQAALAWGCPPGGAVLDLFCGSGVATVEAARTGRRALGIDLNPLAVHVARHTLEPVDEALLVEAFQQLARSCREEVMALYAFPCGCGETATLSHVIWDEFYTQYYHPSQVKYNCPRCGKRGPLHLEPGQRDEARGLGRVVPRLKVRLHESAHQSVETVDQLFTERAQLALEEIYQSIKQLPDARMRDWMRFVFTAALPQASRLVFVIDHRGRSKSHAARYKSELGSWTIPNYWIPKRHFEVNAWNCFEERFRKVLRGKRDTLWQSLAGSGEFRCGDAAEICGTLPEKSFDMLFADPPYGGAVPYLGLSLMWAAWTEQAGALDFAREITIPAGDPQVGLERFRRQLVESFRAARRVLKPGAPVVVTFNQKRPQVWQALDEAMLEAGYQANGRHHVPAARQSAKSLLVPEGSMQGDVWLTYHAG